MTRSRERIGKLFKGDVAKSFVPIESFHYAKSIGAITPLHPRKFDLNIHNPLRTSSRDEELAGEAKENTVTKKYNITLSRLPNIQSVLLYPTTRLKSDSKIDSIQLISIIYNIA